MKLVAPYLVPGMRRAPVSGDIGMIGVAEPLEPVAGQHETQMLASASDLLLVSSLGPRPVLAQIMPWT